MFAKNEIQTKRFVTVTEMARMVGLSRARFYQLQGTTFPLPVYDVSTRRPIYVEEQQKVCLEVRRRNCGIDGKPVLFYARRPEPRPTTVAPRRPTKAKKPKADPHSELIEALKSLGLVATSGQVASAVKEMFPNGTSGIEQSEVIRTVFVRIKRQN